MISAVQKKPGVLLLICGCLLLSGILRLGSVGTAVASADVEPDNRSEVEIFNDKTDEIAVMLDEIQKRGEELDARETSLNALEKTLTEARKEIFAKLQELEAAEASLLSTIDRVQSAAETDVAGLTKVYETMKPKDAALLFEQMEPRFAAGFLAEMNANAAAGILAGLTSEKAYAISVVLAGRNSAPKAQ